MAVFMVERRYADQLEVTADIADGINRINDEEGVRWLKIFFSADNRRPTVCTKPRRPMPSCERPSAQGCPPTYSSR